MVVWGVVGVGLHTHCKTRHTLTRKTFVQHKNKHTNNNAAHNNRSRSRVCDVESHKHYVLEICFISQNYISLKKEQEGVESRYKIIHLKNVDKKLHNFSVRHAGFVRTSGIMAFCLKLNF